MSHTDASAPAPSARGWVEDLLGVSASNRPAWANSDSLPFPVPSRLTTLVASGVPDSSSSAETGQTTHLPLMSRPSRIALVDDDTDFLSMLEFILGAGVGAAIRTFSRPQAALNELQQEPPLWEADLWAQQSIVDQWRGGQLLIPGVLDYWLNTEQRYDLTSVLVIDYQMPGLTGLDVLSELGEWQGQRILLTGTQDESMTTRAFNAGLINRLLSKSTPGMADKLAKVVAELMQRTNPRIHQIWASTLRPQQLALLRDPAVERDLLAFAKSTWKEWVVLGEPFGILGLDNDGRATWLQLEPTADLHAMVEIAEQTGVSRADIDQIKAARCVTNIEFLNAIEATRPQSMVPAFYVGDSGKLLAAIHRIHFNAETSSRLSYRRWLAQVRQETRGAH